MDIKNRIVIALKGAVIWLTIFDGKGRTVTAIPLDAGQADDIRRLLETAILQRLEITARLPDIEPDAGGSVRA